MRKAQKQELSDCVKSLWRAHEEIKNALLQKNTASAQNILVECQQLAISMGENIESLEGEGHITVSFLEQYCELLYQLYEDIANGGNSVSKLGKALRKQLIAIENSVRDDIRVKKEVVFLPYKASMWDSLESVWMAANQDADCDAYVVAIPYFERNRDQSLGQMHCESAEYPDDVPITDWQQYHLEERRPDVIYIQNPYDDGNLVTCVHPRYFSRELKKYTDKLVYIPYFVGIGDRVEEHFCTTAGVMYADQVIVQSEEVKRIYIESIQKFEQEYHCEGAFGDLEKKILPLGSPKLDRIRRINAGGKVDIPEEWKDKIHLPDGSRKKVIFYNTSIETLLKYNEAYIKKLKSVLGIFREEKDIVLLWRPHPLLETTLKSMRPNLYSEYMEIVKDYRKQGWGIYDETADVDRAIVVSDAYYGDWSSVVELYKVTGKPIMIQNCETEE